MPILFQRCRLLQTQLLVALFLSSLLGSLTNGKSVPSGLLMTGRDASRDSLIMDETRMSETKSALMAQAAKSSDAPPAATGSTQAVSPRGRFFANPTFHFETLRNAGYIVSNCADLD